MDCEAKMTRSAHRLLKMKRIFKTKTTFKVIFTRRHFAEEDEDDEEDDDDDDVNAAHIDGMYDPEEFIDLDVNSEIR